MFSEATIDFEPASESEKSTDTESIQLESDIPTDFERALDEVYQDKQTNNILDTTTLDSFYKDVIKNYNEIQRIYVSVATNIANLRYLEDVWTFLLKKNGEDEESSKYNTVDKIEKDREKIKVNDIKSAWPSVAAQRRTNNQKIQQLAQLNQFINDITKENMEIYKQYLPQVNDKITSDDFSKIKLKEIYNRKQNLLNDINKAEKIRTDQDDYNKRLKYNTNELQKSTLPSLVLDKAWRIVNQDELNTNIKYPMTILKKGNSYGVFFGKNNFIMKYETNATNFLNVIQGKQTRQTLTIDDNKTILFDKNNNVTIQQFNIFFDNLGEENKAKLLHLKLNNNVELATNQIEIKNNKPSFLKDGKSLKDEQALIVQQAPQNWLIFHDPGVGKTLNALAVAIKNLEEEGNIHVVAPSKSILTQWQKTLEDWIDPRIKNNINLTTQTQAMFIKVCNDGSKGSFYDFYEGNQGNKRAIYDDITLKKLDLKGRNFEFGPNMMKLLNQIITYLNLQGRDDDVFDNLFVKKKFLQDFLRSFWSYCFIFDHGNFIWIFANVVLSDEGLSRTLTTDMFRPMNQSDLDQDPDLKTNSFNEFLNKLKNVENGVIPPYVKTEASALAKVDKNKYVDYGKIKIEIINTNIEKFKWNEVPKEDPIEHFPMLGKNTILIIDESHNVISNNLEKKSVRFVSDVARHCKNIICCSATPFNSAEKIEIQMYAYGRILNRDPIHYFNLADNREKLILLGLELVRNKVTGKKKVTSVEEQQQKINNVLQRVRQKGDMKKNLQSDQDLLFRRLNYDFFELFKPLTNFFKGDKKKNKEDKEEDANKVANKVAGLNKNEYVHLSPELQSYATDKNIDFAKRRILYRQLENIFKIDGNTDREKIYPTVIEKVIMFSFSKETSKRFTEIKLLNRNDYMVAYKSIKIKRCNKIDNKWEVEDFGNNGKINYCYEGKGNAEDDNKDKNDSEDTNDVVTVFTNKGNINPNIFVPDLIPSKIKFMVEEALEHIILNHKNVMIYSFLTAPNQYNREVFKMYNVKELTIFADQDKSTKDNVIQTLNKNKIILNGALKEVAYKLRLKWKSWEKFEGPKNKNVAYQQKDENQIMNFLKVTLHPLPEGTYDNYNNFVENEKEKIWKQRILGEGALPYYIAKTIDGKMDTKERQVVQELFNLGILDICLISDAGAQGTDFKSTRESMMYVASTDQRAVPAKILQFKGRLNRKYSHKTCPPEKRNVTYTRICLYKSVRADKDQSRRMSYFFYYKVPKKGFAIDFSYSSDFASKNETDFPEKCPFCNLSKEADATDKCDCIPKSSKTYYYLKPSSPNDKSVKSLHNEREKKEEISETRIYCNDFFHYDRFLKRLLNLELLTLLLKTESIEHNYYAEKIKVQTNLTEYSKMRFMAIQEDDYWYFKRICYKGDVSIDINMQKATPKNKNILQGLRKSDRLIKKKESGKLPKLRRRRKVVSGNLPIKSVQQNLPRTKDDLEVGMRIDIGYEEEDENGNKVIKYYTNYTYAEDDKGKYAYWYDDKKFYDFDPKKDDWKYSKIPDVEIGTVFKFKLLPNNFYEVTEAYKDGHTFDYTTYGDSTIGIPQMKKTMNNKGEGIIYPLDLWYHVIDIVEQEDNPTTTTTVRSSKRNKRKVNYAVNIVGDDEEDSDESYIESDDKDFVEGEESEEEEEASEEEEESEEEIGEYDEYDEDGEFNDLINDPVDSILKSYPYLSLD